MVVAAGLSVGIGQQPTPNVAPGEASDIRPIPTASGMRMGEPSPVHAMPAASTPTIGLALDRPMSFLFSNPTPLREVALYIQETIGMPVVLDVAALSRRGIEADAPVELNVKNVRLRTGLKLLLDQVGLTWHVVPEDNLLIVTDREGSEEPGDRMMAEIEELHRDIHDLQDAVDELRQMLMGPGEGGPVLRAPTIIQELPGEEAPVGKPGVESGTPTSTHARPG
jgi:hypothetical protein